MNFSKNFLFLTAIIFISMINSVLAQGLIKNSVTAMSDSRVTVIVLEEDGGEIIHNEISTSILNAKLLEMGFKPVLDANHIIKLRDAQLLENVYKGYPEEFIHNLDSVTDYLVIGRCMKSENDLDFYDYYEDRKIESPLKSVRVNLKVDVIIYDTGEIISSFATLGIGFGGNLSRANDNAIEIAANQAADKLEDALKNFSERSTLQILFTVHSDDYEKLNQIVEDLRSIDSINFVQIREQRGKTMILSVEAYQPPSIIVQLLKERTNLHFYIERLSGNSCTLRFSDREDNDDEKVFDDADDYELDDDKRY